PTRQFRRVPIGAIVNADRSGRERQRETRVSYAVSVIKGLQRRRGGQVMQGASGSRQARGSSDNPGGQGTPGPAEPGGAQHSPTLELHGLWDWNRMLLVWR